MKRVSVVILNWNGVDMLRKFIPSVMDNSVGEGIEICVADNASSDGSLEMLRSEFPVVRLIELDQNYGFAEGYNRALEQVDAEYVVLLNSDVEVTPHWLEPLLDYMDTHSGTVACQPKLLSWHNKEYFEYAGASGGFIDRYGYPFCRGRIFDVVEKDCGQYDTVTAGCKVAHHCAMAFSPILDSRAEVTHEPMPLSAASSIHSSEPLIPPCREGFRIMY